MRHVRWLVICSLMLVVISGCGDDDASVDAGDDTPSPPSGEPQFSGMVTSVQRFVPVTEDCIDGSDLDPDGSVSSDDPPICTDPDNTNLGTVLLEEQPGVQEGDKISLAIDEDTVLLQRVDGGFQRISFDDLSMGDAADAWVFGAVAESYPMQGRADALVVG